MVEPEAPDPAPFHSTVPRNPIRRNGEGRGPPIDPTARHIQLVAEITDLGRVMRSSDGRGGWSTGERIAGALLCDEITWLPDGYTLAAAIDRLGPAWLPALLEAGTGNLQFGYLNPAERAGEDLIEKVAAIADSLSRDNGGGPWSTGERCAGALLAGVPAWLPSGFTLVEAIERIRGNWLTAVVEADRRGWQAPA